MYFWLTYLTVFFMTTLSGEDLEWKSKIAWGNTQSSNEIYLFTDWLCPACHALEPSFEEWLPSLRDKSAIYFIDLAGHPESMHFLKYDLSFMIYQKNNYIKTRAILSRLSTATHNPTDEQVNQELAKLKVRYQPIPQVEVEAMSNEFKAFAKKFHINATPTMILKNVKTGKERRLVGQKITLSNVLETLDQIGKS